METDYPTPGQLILRVLVAAGISVVVAGSGFLFGALMLAFATDSCHGASRVDIVFVVWTVACVVAGLVPPAISLWKKDWKPALLSVLFACIGLVAVLVACFYLIIRICG